MKRLLIECSPYASTILVRIGGSVESAEKEFRKAFKLSEPHDFRFSRAFVVRPANSLHLGMWFESCRPSPDIIAHESIHAAIFVLDNAGVKIDPDNHEALTYLAESIVRKVWRRSRE